jgi:hypothetical protein
MASAHRTAQALPPTNAQVNTALSPHDTVQSRLTDPQWLQRWLDGQIHFDDAWERKVVDPILHNLALLLGRTFATVTSTVATARKSPRASLPGTR